MTIEPHGSAAATHLWQDALCHKRVLFGGVWLLNNSLLRREDEPVLAVVAIIYAYRHRMSH